MLEGWRGGGDCGGRDGEEIEGQNPPTITFIVEEAVLGEDKPAFLPQLEAFTALLVQPALQDHRRRVAPLDGQRRRGFDRRNAATTANAAAAGWAGGFAAAGRLAAVHAVRGTAVLLLTVLPTAVQPKKIEI